MTVTVTPADRAGLVQHDDHGLLLADETGARLQPAGETRIAAAADDGRALGREADTATSIRRRHVSSHPLGSRA